MEKSSRDLIIQFNRGDSDALITIFDDLYPTLYYFVKRFIDEREDVEDITATIFLKLWKLRADFESLHDVRAFLYATARNTCLDLLRSREIMNRRQEELLHALLQTSAKKILQDDVRALVMKCIFEEMENLPGNCKKVFSMSFVKGMSNKEVAEALQLTSQSVRSSKHRAIKLLRIAILNRDIIVNNFIYCCILTWLSF